jgi:MFS transporter, Spinster family, sphingosine-1-phosphate transporter
MIRRPIVIIALLTALNFLNYLDRLVLAAVLPKLQGELSLSNFQGGLLSTVFLLGYFITAPVFGILADRGSRRQLLALGVLMWSVATVVTGLVHSTPALFVARAFVGIGEASFVTLAPTLIDDLSPPDKKGKMLSIFFLAVPLGAAAGYLVGGAVEASLGWRAAFWVAGGPGVVLAAVCMLIKEPQRKLAREKISLLKSARVLFQYPMFRLAVFGYTAHTAAVGAFAHWAPKFLESQYDLNLKSANFRFGTITVVAGAIGTVIGGRWADRSQRGLPMFTADTSPTNPSNLVGMASLLKICAIGVLGAGLISFACFGSSSKTMFFVLVFFVEIGIFISTSPVNAVLLRSVPSEMRASGTALCMFCIHLFGDLWSPAAVGKMADIMPMQTAMMILPVMLCGAALLWWPFQRAIIAPSKLE